MTKILVAGSIVYDEIFNINGKIKDGIILKDGQISSLNLMFTAKEKERRFGGTAGNIGYGQIGRAHI